MNKLSTLAVAAITAAAAAQPAITWYSMDNGFGVSTGSGYTLTGVIAQQDAGPPPQTNGGLRLVGGFMPAFIVTRCGPVDFGSTGGAPGADGILNNNDFIVFIDLFFANSPLADIGSAGGTQGGDSLWNNNDFVVFIDLFFAGC